MTAARSKGYSSSSWTVAHRTALREGSAINEQSGWRWRLLTSASFCGLTRKDASQRSLSARLRQISTAEGQPESKGRRFVQATTFGNIAAFGSIQGQPKYQSIDLRVCPIDHDRIIHTLMLGADHGHTPPLHYHGLFSPSCAVRRHFQTRLICHSLRPEVDEVLRLLSQPPPPLFYRSS